MQATKTRTESQVVSLAKVIAIILVGSTILTVGVLLAILIAVTKQPVAKALAMPVPVLVLGFYPEDPARPGYLDPRLTGSTESISVVRSRNVQAQNQAVQLLSENSSFRGYSNSLAPKSLKFSIMNTMNFIFKSTDAPGQNTDAPGYQHGDGTPAVSADETYNLDYRYILTDLLKKRYSRDTLGSNNDIDICKLVDSGYVKQVWIWSWHRKAEIGPAAGYEIGPVESNMSMGRSVMGYWNYDSFGDVSNSGHVDDLPTCQKSYVVLNLNLTAGAGNILHDYGHQLEVTFRWVDKTLYENWSLPFGHITVSGEFSVSPNKPALTVTAEGGGLVVTRASSPADPKNLNGYITVSSLAGLPTYTGPVNDSDPLYTGTTGQLISTANRRYWLARPDGQRYDLKIIVWHNQDAVGFKLFKPSADTNTIFGCGNLHTPPNGESEYDYRPRNDGVFSDCQRWNPDQPITAPAQAERISCANWSCADTGIVNPTDSPDLAYYRWWMQNFPGEDNQLTYNGKPLINWWRYIGDFDQTLLTTNKRLVYAPLRPQISVKIQTPAATVVRAGGTGIELARLVLQPSNLSQPEQIDAVTPSVSVTSKLSPNNFTHCQLFDEANRPISQPVDLKLSQISLPTAGNLVLTGQTVRTVSLRCNIAANVYGGVTVQLANANAIHLPTAPALRSVNDQVQIIVDTNSKSVISINYPRLFFTPPLDVEKKTGFLTGTPLKFGLQITHFTARYIGFSLRDPITGASTDLGFIGPVGGYVSKSWRIPANFVASRGEYELRVTAVDAATGVYVPVLDKVTGRSLPGNGQRRIIIVNPLVRGNIMNYPASTVVFSDLAAGVRDVFMAQLMFENLDPAASAVVQGFTMDFNFKRMEGLITTTFGEQFFNRCTLSKYPQKSAVAPARSIPLTNDSTNDADEQHHLNRIYFNLNPRITINPRSRVFLELRCDLGPMSNLTEDSVRIYLLAYPSWWSVDAASATLDVTLAGQKTDRAVMQTSKTPTPVINWR